MASKYGVYQTLQQVSVPAEKIDSNALGGSLRVCYDSYTLAADLASGDKIYLGKLPAGARILQCILSYADLDASGGTIDVGYEYCDSSLGLTNDADAFLANVDVTSAGSIEMSAQANMVGFGAVLEAEAYVVATIDGDTDATSGTVKCFVQYALT